MIKKKEKQKKTMQNTKMRRGTSLKSKKELLKIKKHCNSFKKQEKLIKNKLLKLKHNTHMIKNYQKNIFFNINLRKFNESIKKEKFFNKQSSPYIMGFLDNNISKMFINCSVREKTGKTWNKLKIIQKLGGFSNQNKKPSLNLKRKSIFPTSTKSQKKNYKTSKIRPKKSILKITKTRNSLPKFKINLNNRLNLPNYLKKKHPKNENIEIPLNLKKLYKTQSSFNQNFPLETKALTKGGIYRSKFYISGGINQESSKRMQIFNLNNFKSIFIENGIFERFNHLTIFESCFMIVNGGMHPSSKKMRNDTFILNLKNNNIFEIPNFNVSLPQLRNHIGFYHDNKLYIEGGIGNLNKFNKKFYSIDLITFICSEVILKNKTENLAYHKSVKISIEDYSNLRIKYNQNSCEGGQILQKQKSKFQTKKKSFLEAIYIFGGLNEKKNCNSTLKIYKKILNKIWQVTYPPVKGFIPPRFDHEMVFIEEIKSLAICGGRAFIDNKSKTEIFLNDLFIFSVKNLSFFKVYTGNDAFKRYGFSLGSWEGDLVVFGGMREENFIDGVFVKYVLDRRIFHCHMDFFL